MLISQSGSLFKGRGTIPTVEPFDFAVLLCQNLDRVKLCEALYKGPDDWYIY